ncbi:uncharacterized protein [Paramisgurnus dabryanus]|uniref:uncharacterized protein isoform X2 n=1 Tax=Paramisgurnus dabryanus TaxID=90735 RepID=UPI0031F3D5CC
MMGGVNVILLVLLVWTFTAVSEANIEAVKDDTAGDLNRFTGEGFGESTKETSSQTAVIISVMCLIIIIMGLIYKKKLNFINTCGFQKDYNMDVHEKILSNCSDRETVDINM